ncbi:ferredoxin:glutaredoxin reductase [Candidatus Desantisbacteria bacterium CG02_land_8_20_14_3_00_49_13]|nr:MAG: ferredoxin:glutaredoxin reductase [Candidatus Desantisbacteria bacterium CG02_land_8_20_14_3_00_49_13]
MRDVSDKDIDALYGIFKKDAESGGYYLNPDTGFAKELVRGLIANEERYGYQSCPCRLASGIKKEDLDIICPCDYRDEDIGEYGACYCALYVSGEIAEGKKSAGSIPERRPAAEQRKKMKTEKETGRIENGGKLSLPLPVWRCKVCGYLCARTEPPEICPVCKVKKDRFERFL